MTDTRIKRWKSAARAVGDFVTGGGKQQSGNDFNFVRGCKYSQDAFYDSPRRVRTSLFH